MNSAARLLAGLLALLPLVSAASTPPELDPVKAMSQYVISSWRDNSGLPVDSVTSVAQTKDGYLWLGTEHGLVRFDGIRFTTFSRNNTPAFLTNEIFTLFVSSNGNLWIGTRGGGAVKFDGKTFLRVPVKYRYIVGFAESANGAVWIGAPGGLARFRDGRYTTYEKAQGYPGGRLTTIAADGDSAYAALPEGVLRIGDHPVQKWTTSEGLGSGYITALRWTPRGLLAGSETGEIFRLEGNRFVSLLKLPSQNTIMSMIEGRSGTLWIGTAGGGIFRYAGGKLSQLSERDGLTTDSINELTHDHEGNLWVATTGGGLMRLKEGKVSSLVPPQPLHGEWILPLLQARDGSIWFATNGGGLNRLKDNNLVRMTTADGLQMNLISALAEDRAGSLWVGSDSGLQRIEGGRVVQTYGKADGFEALRVFGITPARDGSVWVSANNGLYHFVNHRARKLTEKDGMTPGYVLSVREAADGSLWLAKPNCVEHLVEGKVTSFGRADGLLTQKISSITIDEKDGSIWIATAGDGLGRIRNGKVTFYRASHGLLTDSVYGVIHDREGNLWIPTSLGLFTINRPDLEQFDSGKIATIPIQVFRKSDGLKSSDFTGGMDRPGFRAFDGKLWFPTTRGMAIVDPENIRSDRTPPRVIIESITANGITYAGAAARIDLPAGNRQLEIAYTAPSYYSPESTTFRYKLEGFDTEWRDAGPRRTAYYTNVPPGTYRFLVQATTADSATAMTDGELIIEPEFYETVPFKVAVGLLVLLFALVLHRRRVDKIHRHQEALRRSEEHFRSLIENGSDMIFVVERDGTLSYASPSAARSLGVTAAELTGKAVTDLLANSDAAVRFLAEVRYQGRFAATLPFRDAAGMQRDVESIGVTHAQDGQIILNCRDITERRKLEMQLEQANRLASLGRLAATVSHEFNNVLMGIQPFVEILKRKSTDRMVHRATDQMTHSITRGKRISEEILRFTRPIEPTLQPVLVRRWLQDLETEIRAHIGPNVRMGMVVPEGLTIDGDTSQLSQVITNLAINARDAGSAAIRIEARPVEGNGVFPFGIIREPEGMAHITFSDNGSGIPESVLPNIFEPLFTTKTTKGTGLGLAVAQQVISRHGGEMFVESRVGSGTTFHLFLPIAVSAAGELLSGDDGSLAAGAPCCRILLVEDDPIVAEGLVTVLEDEGFEIALACNGGDALNLIPRFSPEIVILDIGLPDIDGVELYHRIAKRWPQLRVIFSTGHGDIASIEETVPPPHPVCLLKPYSAETLINAIATTLEHQRVVA